jgi:thiol-disulfide isomerase/thioredoxin
MAVIRRIGAALLLVGVMTLPAASSAAPAPVESFARSDPPRPLPDVSFVDATGARRHLADFRGKLVLVNLWATWCGPCRKELPALDRLQAKLGGSRFEVVALSIDRAGLPKVGSFLRDLGITKLAIYVDRTGEAARLLGAAGLPTTLLVDRTGEEIGRLAGEASWDGPEFVGFFEELLKGDPG